jgi:flap endonuclease-1
MGVKHLNTYLKTHCVRGIHEIHLSKLKQKKVVVDTSIYLYKYKSQELLLSRMEQFIQTFKSLEITPIFVFDGKPKPVKQKTLQARQHRKNVAWEQYNKLLKEKSPESLQYLKTQFTKINQTDVLEVKKLMDSLGVLYIEAPNEADEVCATLMLTTQVYACISDDMDMLIHGCKYVVREVNIDTQTAIMYNLNNILKSLRIDHHTFKQLCVLSGTDYNSSSFTLFHSIHLLKKI